MNLSIFRKWKGSANYWEKRYRKGGNSGSGSYNRLAEFKAEVINTFLDEHEIDLTIEWGCGDGNQLSLMNYTNYIGYDVSKTAIAICKKKYQNDKKKRFIWSGDSKFDNKYEADLAVSLDVVFHLVEDEVFDNYMKNLFLSSKKYIIIYSSNYDHYTEGSHQKDRKFTDWIDANSLYTTGWKLERIIPNQYPYDENDKDNTSVSDFYIYCNENV